MQDKFTKFAGLQVQFNPLTMAPGALLRANDCYIRRENVIEDRRGYKAYATLGSNVKNLLVYDNRVIAHRGSTLSYDDGTGIFSDFTGSYSEPTNSKIRGTEANSNLYATTSAGVKVFASLSATAAKLAGAPRALDLSFALTGATGFLATASQCAYRWVIQRTDSNDNVVTGYPSDRVWVTNTAGASRNVILTGYLPAEAAAGDVVQVYRTEQFAGTASDLSGDETGIVYQYELTAGDIVLGYISFTDSVTDALRGATLYTSPSQEGIGQANDRPPVANDLALYKSNYLLYANTQTKQRLFFSLVGVSALTGKTITLGGVTYNFGATEIISGGGAPKALVGSTGVAAVDIDTTARSLVKVINRYASNTTIYAYYLSGPDDLPGKIMIEERGLGAAAFTLQASDAAIAVDFFPAPPVSPSTSSKSTSSNDVSTNRVYYSKSQQLEHVPALNYLPVGPANKQILRIIALRDSAIIVKEEGVYRLSGETPQSFVITPIDLTVYCKSPDSVVALSNQVFMLSNQGVVLISETGVQVVSREIEPLLLPLIASTNLPTNSYGCSYESERSYFLSMITETGDMTANQTFVYNVFTRAWVRHTYGFKAAVVESSTDKIYFAKNSDSVVYQERKDFDTTDFADPESSITITALNAPASVDFTISGATPDVGWIISQNNTDAAIESLTTIPGGGYRATLAVDFPAAWVTGVATIYPSVGMDIEFHSWTGQGNPDLLKQVRMVGVLTDDIPGNNSVSSLDATFRTNFDSEEEIVTIVQPGEGWGGAWGATPWGGASDPSGYPTYVPRNKQYCTRMNVGIRHKVAREHLVITGLAFSYEVSGDRIGR